MLVELSIRNFALIPSLTLSLKPGLNVFTGESGAGKSMIIDALGLLVGGRASVDYVRQGSDKAEIEALFILPEVHPAKQICHQLGIELSDNSLIVCREISTSGRNVCRLNDRLVTLATLREVGQLLLQIQDQNEQQDLLNSSKHLALLDRFMEEQIGQTKRLYQQVYDQLISINQTLKQLEQNEREALQQLDFLKFQYEEIQNSQLEIGEDERLEKEKHIKKNIQKIAEGIGQALDVLYGERGAFDLMSAALSHLEQASAIDDSLAPLFEQLSSAYYQVEDVVHQLRKYYDQMDFDPHNLTSLESRLAQIDQLKRKYGSSIEEILAYAEKIKTDIDKLENRSQEKERLLQERDKILPQLLKTVNQLTELRKNAAIQLVHAIQKELADLYMDGTEMEIRFSSLPSGGAQIEWEGAKRWLSREGWDKIEWLIAPNPGEPAKPLAKIASGGELTRLLLAMKTVLAQSEPVTTLVFDEIDTGVSGRVAQAMAEKLYTISLKRQVICITHQPQAAAMADHHVYIHKETVADNTFTSLSVLDYQERQVEIARMMSGKNLTERSKQHVEELMAEAERIKAHIQQQVAIR